MNGLLNRQYCLNTEFDKQAEEAAIAWENLPQEERDFLAISWERQQRLLRRGQVSKKVRDIRKTREDFLAWRAKKSNPAQSEGV